MAEELRANIGWKSSISLQRGPVDPKFQVEGVILTNRSSSSQKTRLNDLSFGIKIWTDLSSVLSQFTRLMDRRTDRRTDSFLIARPRLHSMQRGNEDFKGHHVHTSRHCLPSFWRSIIMYVNFPKQWRRYIRGSCSYWSNDLADRHFPGSRPGWTK